jgi:hypothetical protein
MQGGQQTISLGPDCSLGNAIHEIGHAIGLWHEQSREDRDLFVTINWQNVQPGMAAQFNQHIIDGDDFGGYDYGSIMHYPRNAFAVNRQIDTITPTDPNAQIGQRNGLSAGDIAGVRAMYPGCAVKQPWAEPVGFKKFRDDMKQPWAEPVGFKKQLDDPPPTFKKFRDDDRFKKVNDDLGRKPLRDPGPIKGAFDPMPIERPGIGTQPGTLRPFGMATPHHAPAALGFGGATGMGGADAASYLSALEQQLLDLEAAIAEANATTTRANADIARLQEARDAIVSTYEDAVRQLGGAT